MRTVPGDIGAAISYSRPPEQPLLRRAANPHAFWNAVRVIVTFSILFLETIGVRRALSPREASPAPRPDRLLPR